MKRVLLILTVILLYVQQTHAQQKQTWTEDFEGASPPTGWNVVSSSISGSWQPGRVYPQADPLSPNLQYYRGKLPGTPGDSVVLTTPSYDCTPYEYVYLRFSHICKVSPLDNVRIEYRRDGMGDWNPLPEGHYYLGSGNYTGTTGFNAASYPEWLAGDSTALPAQSWWKDELFDLSTVAGVARVEFRFIIKHGSVQGTHVSYGWLLDDFRLEAAEYEIHPPTVAFINPLVKDTVNSTGPWEINARVESNTAASIVQPWLKYQATYQGVVVKSDSVLMSPVRGSSLWKASIEQFVAGTEVSYSITGYDNTGNNATQSSSYIIKQFCEYGRKDSLVSPAWTGDYQYAGVSFDMKAGPEAVAITGISPLLNPGSQTITIYYRTNSAENNYNTTAGWILIGSATVNPATKSNTYIPFNTPVTIPAGEAYGFYIHGNNYMVPIPNNPASGGFSTALMENDYLTVTEGYALRDYALPSSSGYDLPRAFVGAVHYISGDVSGRCDDNSVTLYSIDMPDTVVVTPTTSLPIIATIRNRGGSDIHSVTVSYSVNNAAPVSKNLSITPGLPWDYNHRDTVGHYTPKGNGFDTVAVWVSLPNGQQDPSTWDDTLTKFVYGSSDIRISFVKPPADTVYKTGPYTITAKITTVSGTQVGPVDLFVETTSGGTTSFDTLEMTSGAGNLFTATIPQLVFGSDVAYSIRLKDMLDNNAEETGRYYIKRITASTPTGYVTVGYGALTDESMPANLGYNYSYSRMLYLASEIATNGTITRLAWEYDHYSAGLNLANQTCYLKAVDENKITNHYYVDPITDGATLVWQGTLSATAAGWVEITLNEPFMLPPGKNLLVYWNHQKGSFTMGGWKNSFSSSDMVTTGYWGSSFNDAITKNWKRTYRPIVRFYLIGEANLQSSVALNSINIPENKKGVIAGVPSPVQVTIRNKGRKNLDSCVVNWTLNGQVQAPAGYYGELPDDFTDTITIGSYAPTAGKLDTITVWVSMPNGVKDSTTRDDTLTVISFGCLSIPSGEVTVGEGGEYALLEDVFNTIRNCGVGGDLTLKLKGVFDGNIDLSDLTDYLKGYHLTITSSDNHPDSAIIRPLSGAGIVLPEIRDITIKAITVDVQSGTVPAIQFTGSCTNIVVRDCKLLGNPTTASSSPTNAPVSKAQSTGNVDSIFFINNLLDGGYYGFYFYGGTSTHYGTHVVFDSNKVSNQYYYATYPYYTDFTSCSYNNILSRTSDISTIWWTLRMDNCNGPVIGNRILQRSNAIQYPYGLYLNSHNRFNVTSAQTRALVANNEIILYTTDASYGIYAYATKSEVIHNSVYISGSGPARGIYIYNSGYEDMVIKNNNIVMASPWAYPIYFWQPGSFSQFDIDYNNYYAPAYVGYYGTNISSLSDWKQEITTDVHSIRTLPPFTDVSGSLALHVYDSLLCPQYPGCNDDILKTPRKQITAMGAYTQHVSAFDLMNSALTVPATAVQGQTITVKVNVTGYGDTLIRNATLGWSLNGVVQTQPPVHAFVPALNIFETAEITLGTFTITNPTENIVVWIDQVNGKKDGNIHNDTLRMILNRVPLVEFVAPFVADTVYQLSFDVNIKVNDGTGAPVSTPKLFIHTTVNGHYPLYDSIGFTQNGAVWTATVPSQYYNSKVVYSVSVSDGTVTDTITDSTYIKFGDRVGSQDMRLPQTGSNSYYKCGTVYPNLGQAFGNNGGYSNYCDGYSVIYPAIPGAKIQVSGSYQTEQLRDYIEIYDGVGTAGIMLGRFDGTGTIPALTSITGPVTIRFYSDANVNTASSSYMGFIIHVACYSSPLYPDNALTVMNVASPVNDPEDLCEPDYVPLKITVTNTGENDYNFAANPIEVGARVINPLGEDTVYIRRIAGGTLLSAGTGTFEITPALPIMYAGSYDIKAWVSSPIDYIAYDDTIHYTFLSGKIGLPVDENFSTANLPYEFISKPLAGANTWEPYQPDINVYPVKPQFGTGMLRFSGTVGSMSVLTTRQMDMIGAVNPKLEFWYFHDTAVTAITEDESYMDVKIIADNLSTTVLSVPKTGNTYGWAQYIVDLSSYTTAQCVLIEFAATNDDKSGALSEQYIDRIFITSHQDLAVLDFIITPEIKTCDMQNKDVYVIVATATNHTIDFSQYPTNLALEIPGYSPFSEPLRKTIPGKERDTVLVASGINFTKGVHTLKAYLTTSIDGNNSNDTASLPLDINPEISVTAQAVSGGTDCLSKGTPVQQKVTVKNTGNLAIPGIEVILNVMASSQQALTKSAGDLNPGDSTDILFDAYTVPADAQYQVQIMGYMDCDSTLVNDGTSVDECVDMDDLAITHILSPDSLDGGIDQVGSTKEIEVSLMNTSDMTNYQHVDITALIEDEHGQVLSSHVDIIPVINALDNNMLFKFSQKYTVPDKRVYYIRVFISKVDNYPENDTISIERSTEETGFAIGKGNIFTMEQNIPNPTDNSTIIRYSIPQSGKVIFRIHSMNGQILYNKVIDSESGNQRIEINTLELSSGIYMYSMEYKGQRIVKRMSIK